MSRAIFRVLPVMAVACCGLAIPFPASAAKPAASTANQAGASSGAMIKAYKRDPLPIYDDEGEKIRDVGRAELPAIGSPAARVVRAKPGFVGIMLDGKLAWLRLSTVDYIGDVNAIKCDAMAMKFAQMEEEGLDQSLGLGCAH